MLFANYISNPLNLHCLDDYHSIMFAKLVFDTPIINQPFFINFYNFLANELYFIMIFKIKFMIFDVMDKLLYTYF